MQIFYENTAQEVATLITIEGQEHIHLAKVLRKKEGDAVFVANGLGKLFSATVKSVSKKRTQIYLNEIVKESIKRSNLTLAISPTRNINRYEWLIEKCTEIGVAQFISFTSFHSERRSLKLDRLKLISVGAMKQSKQLFLPLIDELFSFDKMLKSLDSYEVKLIAYCKEESLRILDCMDTKKKTIVLIGPEGGFSIDEVRLAESFGFNAVTLGHNRLRTETAAVFSASIFNGI